MEGSTVSSTIVVSRERQKKKHTLDDILYIIMGDASVGNALALLFTIIFFATVPVVMVLLFANYSGGMRWLLTLGVVTTLGIMALYLMKRGVRRSSVLWEKNEAKTKFEGQLTHLTDLVERGSVGYVYSQQMLRERICEAIIIKLSVLRDIPEEEIIRQMDSDNYEIVGDDIIAKFLKMYRRGTKGWEKALDGKGKSAERGKKFMVEIELILDRIEEIV